MVDYKQFTVNGHLKPILRAAGVDGISTMNKVDMVTWCEKYDIDHAPQTARDLAPNMPPLTNFRAERSQSTTAKRAAQAHKQKSKATPAPSDEDNAAQDDDGDVRMDGAEEINHRAQDHQVGLRYENWTYEQLACEFLRHTGATQLDERVRSRAQLIKALRKLDDVTDPNRPKGQPQPNTEQEDEPIAPSKGLAPRGLLKASTPKRKQPPTAVPVSSRRVRLDGPKGKSVGPTKTVGVKQQAPAGILRKTATPRLRLLLAKGPGASDALNELAIPMEEVEPTSPTTSCASDSSGNESETGSSRSVTPEATIITAPVSASKKVPPQRDSTPASSSNSSETFGDDDEAEELSANTVGNSMGKHHGQRGQGHRKRLTVVDYMYVPPPELDERLDPEFMSGWEYMRWAERQEERKRQRAAEQGVPYEPPKYEKPYDWREDFDKSM